jgi:hypothetical protein
MNLSYVGNVNITFKGCAKVEKNLIYLYKYAEGSKLYVCNKAQKGIMEAVIIKRILLNSNKFGRFIPIYQDTFGGWYNERDLCDQTSAIALATAYYQNMIIEIDKVLDIC